MNREQLEDLWNYYNGLITSAINKAPWDFDYLDEGERTEAEDKLVFICRQLEMWKVLEGLNE